MILVLIPNNKSNVSSNFNSFQAYQVGIVQDDTCGSIEFLGIYVYLNR